MFPFTFILVQAVLHILEFCLNVFFELIFKINFSIYSFTTGFFHSEKDDLENHFWCDNTLVPLHHWVGFCCENTSSLFIHYLLVGIWFSYSFWLPESWECLVQGFLQPCALFIFVHGLEWRFSKIPTPFCISWAAMRALITFHGCQHLTWSVQNILAMNPFFSSSVIQWT